MFIRCCSGAPNVAAPGAIVYKECPFQTANSSFTWLLRVSWRVMPAMVGRALMNDTSGGECSVHVSCAQSTSCPQLLRHPEGDCAWIVSIPEYTKSTHSNQSQSNDLPSSAGIDPDSWLELMSKYCKDVKFPSSAGIYTESWLNSRLRVSKYFTPTTSARSGPENSLVRDPKIAQMPYFQV